jgi:hypothetical protein
VKLLAQLEAPQVVLNGSAFIVRRKRSNQIKNQANRSLRVTGALQKLDSTQKNIRLMDQFSAALSQSLSSQSPQFDALKSAASQLVVNFLK